MPRGGHRGGIYPISGLSWGPGQRYLKRGLFAHQRSDILTPRWGMRRDRINHSPLPDGSTKRWEPDSHSAWRTTGSNHHLKMYYANENRYLWPAQRCNDPKVKEYILNTLEYGHTMGRIYSGIGRMDVCGSFNTDNNPYMPLNLYKSAQAAGAIKQDGTGLLKPYVSYRNKIKRLYEVVCEADIWRSSQNSGSSSYASHNSSSLSNNPFPHVDESAALVRELPLGEILYSKSNHRLKLRRHPYWMNMRYKKDKYKVPYLHRRKIARQELQTKELGSWQVLDDAI